MHWNSSVNCREWIFELAVCSEGCRRSSSSHYTGHRFAATWVWILRCGASTESEQSSVADTGSSLCGEVWIKSCSWRAGHEKQSSDKQFFWRRRYKSKRISNENGGGNQEGDAGVSTAAKWSLCQWKWCSQQLSRHDHSMWQSLKHSPQFSPSSLHQMTEFLVHVEDAMKPVKILSNLWLLRWQVLLHIASVGGHQEEEEKWQSERVGLLRHMHIRGTQNECHIAKDSNSQYATINFVWILYIISLVWNDKWVL